MSKIEDLTMIREMRRSEVNLVLATWMKAIRKQEPFWKLPCPEVFFGTYQEIIKRTLDKCVTIVVCPIKEPNIIIGYVVLEPLDVGIIIHFVFVKYKFRRNGIGSFLIRTVKDIYNPEKIIVSHFDDHQLLAESEYNPFFFLRNCPNEPTQARTKDRTGTSTETEPREDYISH